MQEGVGRGTLVLMQEDYFLFDSVCRYEVMGCCGTVLIYTEGAVYGFVFDGGIPPLVDVDDID